MWVARETCVVGRDLKAIGRKGVSFLTRVMHKTHSKSTTIYRQADICGWQASLLLSFPLPQRRGDLGKRRETSNK